MIKFGTTRMVIILITMVIKIPIFWKGAKVLRKGLMGNIDELNLWNQLKDSRLASKLAPTHFSLFGFANFMERAEPFYFDKKLSDASNAKILLKYFSDMPIEVDICSRSANFGTINNVIVLIDYTQMRESTDECDNCYCQHINK